MGPTYPQLDQMLSHLDANPSVTQEEVLMIADQLEEQGRLPEAAILRTCRMCAIRQLVCGHWHVRRTGMHFSRKELGRCAWTRGAES